MKTGLQNHKPQRALTRRLFMAAMFLLMLPISVLAQINLSGTVIDENDEPLVGVVVTSGEGENRIATTTDLDGHFYLTVEHPGAILHFSFIGYKPYEVKVGKKINFDIKLEPNLSELEEVVVVGYGKQVRASVVGSISSVEPDVLVGGGTRSLTDNLAGQLAGVIAVKPSGEPGYDSSNFWIRGISSFRGNTSPLVLIDGVERSLDDIDASEIESFSILKDASASAMYGVRGANGVVLVNTKRGKLGAPTVSFRVEQSFQKPTKIPSFIGAGEYMSLMNDLSKKEVFSSERIQKTNSGYDRDLYPDVDWIDAITKDYSENTRANLSISGGSDFLRYSLTASFFRETGILNRDKRLDYDTSTGLNKYNVRANIDMDLTKTTQIRFNVGGFIQDLRKNASSTDEVFAHAFETVPFIHPVIYSDGVIPREGSARHNAWAELTQMGFLRKNDSKIEALISAEQNLKMLLPGLKVRALFSFDNASTKYVNRKRIPTYYNIATERDDEGNLVHGYPQNTDGTDFLGHSINADFGNSRTYFEAAMTYNELFNNLHRVDAMFLYDLSNYDCGDIQPFRSQGIAGRFSYSYDYRYVGEFNFGYNGSENFAKGHRYGFFPSFALGWIVSNEKFMERFSPSLSKLKIRASVGKVGNDQINGRRFAYITTIDQNMPSYNWGTDGSYYPGSGLAEGEIGVEDLTWETVTKYNLGAELGLWNMLDLQIEFFKEDRKNIFMPRSVIPTQTGFIKNPWANFGRVKNQGFEMSLDIHKSLSKDLAVSLRANFTYAKNKVVECDEPESVKGTYRSLTGNSINTLWGLQADGLYTSSDFNADGSLKEGLARPQFSSSNVCPGDIKYVDRNNDGVINTLDEGYVGGTIDPRIVYGFGGNVIYRNFDFNFFFQGTGDSHRIIGGTSYFIPGSGQGLLGNIYDNYNDCWSEENQSQDVFWPRLTYGQNLNNQQKSTWWKKDMSYLRLKTIEVGYSLPKSLVKKYGAQSTRIYVSGNNLFTFSKFNLWDPELDTNDGLRYPSMRSIIVGIDFKF